MLILLNFAPYAIGGFLGAPLLARELEAGTWQLAWTQAVPRLRWLAFKVVVLGTVSVLLAAGLSAVIGWYRRPLDLLGGFDITGFDLTGIAPHGVHPVCVRARVSRPERCCAAACRRPPAAFVVFVAVRFTVAGWIRPHFVTPVTRIEAFVPGSGDIIDGTSERAGHDSRLRASSTPAAGTSPDSAPSSWRARPVRAAVIPPSTSMTTASSAGSSTSPSSGTGRFQLIETVTFVVLAALLLALVFWRVRRAAF